jgi:ribosome-binding protein aMBF1 (putative translation factor)
MVAKTLGARIREARERRILTQAELANELGVHVRSIQDYEADRATPRQALRRRILSWLADAEQIPA